MTGSALLKHSWGMVWRNKMDAARISVVLLVVMIVVSFAVQALLAEVVMSMGSSAVFTLLFFQLLQNVLSIFLGAWVAVTWHRYVLLNEAPRGWWPRLHGKEVGSYALWIFFMLIAYMFALFPLMLALVPIIMDIESGTSPNIPLMLIWGVGAFVLMVFVLIAFMRLSPVLVSRAMGERLGIKQAWAATRGSSGAIFRMFLILSLICFGIVIVFGIVFGILASTGLTILTIGIIAPAYLFGGWLLTLLQISMMTTIYGVYVEGRELSL